jgi:hypothetical protein
MQTLDLDDDNRIKPPKMFWPRQFQQERTESQCKFDWIFGVIMPVVCIFFDPFVFSTLGGEPLLGAFKPFAYLLSFTSIVAMMAWLIWGEHLKWLSAVFAGLFLFGGWVALSIGIMMLPFTLVGLLMVIGALGFTPLFTGIVYLRNGVRAARSAASVLTKKLVVYLVLLSALASAVIPYVVNVEINRSLELIRTGDAKTIRTEAFKLRLVYPLVDASSLVSRYRFEFRNESQTDQAKAIADLYWNVKGKDISTVNTIGFLEY